MKATIRSERQSASLIETPAPALTIPLTEAVDDFQQDVNRSYRKRPLAALLVATLSIVGLGAWYLAHRQPPVSATQAANHLKISGLPASADTSTPPALSTSKQDSGSMGGKPVITKHRRPTAKKEVPSTAILQEIDHPWKPEGTTLDLHSGLGAYKVLSKAHFYNRPDEHTERNAFIVHWNNATLKPIKEENDFLYIVFTNIWGQTSKGWLRKKDLVRVDE